jgi:tRNA(Ile)-lysidine synthase
MGGALPIAESELEALLAPLAPFAVLVLAVSGGADSLAMMHLVARWSQLHPHSGRKLVVATVDHGLREGSRGEARWVAGEAQKLHLAHELLTWTGDKPSAGIQDAARQARYALLAALAWRHREAGPVAIVTAHTEDDQAETLLMRLARGSGLDGLTGISPSRFVARETECRLVRPLLAVPGARLRATLQAAGATWIEDPSNDCDRFERVRLRRARAVLETLGLSNDKIALTARRLERARQALDAAAEQLASATKLDLHGGTFASLDAQAFEAAPEETRLRLMARLVAAFGGRDGPLRLSKLEALVARMAQPRFEGATLSGAIVSRRGGDLRVFREPGRAGLVPLELIPGSAAVWDRRFRVWAAPEVGRPVVVRALGARGFAELRQQLDDGRGLPPAKAAATLPAFWRNGELMGVPQLSGLRGAPASWGAAARLYSAEFLW